MLAFIKGKLTHTAPSHVILDTGAIGYKIFIPVSLFTALPPLHSELKLHTSFIVRELSQTLYGFSTLQECECFELLLGVTGIGPKLALSLVGHMPLGDLHRSLTEGNITMLSKVPGIGRKTAERLIIELRDKLAHLVPDSYGISLAGPTDPLSQKINDAMSALINLGYNQLTAQKAIKKSMKDLPEGIHLAELITHALKNV
jgi:Holliday junction DNA helicase RuvA